MSEFVEEDWKLKAHTVVKLRREKTNMLVSLSYVQYFTHTIQYYTHALCTLHLFPFPFIVFGHRHLCHVNT